MTCANRACQAETLYFRKGSLHWIDREDSDQRNPCLRETRPVWLCEECSRKFVIQLWRAPGFQIQPRRPALNPLDAEAIPRTFPAPVPRIVPPMPAGAPRHAAPRTREVVSTRLHLLASGSAA